MKIDGDAGTVVRLSIAVVGPGEGASANAIADAEEAGRLVAEQGWIVLCGGRDSGVMAACARGATAAGGIAIGILPGVNRADAAPRLTVSLPTGLGEARNAVLVTASDAIIACGISPGTTSEIALAVQARKPTVLVRPTAEGAALFERLATGPFQIVTAPRSAIDWIAARCR
jgi:uncharacterized protein (TIGR00725 family)